MINPMNSGEPIYQVITNTIKENIINGKYLPGHILPSVNNLCSIFSASRMTIHKSLKKLEVEGYIYAYPGKGYFVCSPQYSQYNLTFEDDEEHSSLQRIKVITVPENISEFFQLKPSEKVVQMIRVITKNKTIVACDVRYCPYVKGSPTIESEIDYAVFPEMAAAKISPFAFHTHMEISSELAKGIPVEYLQCQEGSPLLVVKRFLVDSKNQFISYSIKYMLPAYGPLEAESGLQLKGVK